MVSGALGSTYGWGYTLYYATNFMFTGLAVAVAFHAGLFNIGGEGQAMLGGLGVALVCLLRTVAALDIRTFCRSCRCCAFWRGLGGNSSLSAGQARQPYRDHHDYVQLHRGRGTELHAGQCDAPRRIMDPATERFSETVHLPTLHDLLAPLGFSFPRPPRQRVVCWWPSLACCCRVVADLAHPAWAMKSVPMAIPRPLPYAGIRRSRSP